MSTREHESNLHERVAKLEAGSDAVVRMLTDLHQEMGGIRQEMRELRQEMREGFSQVRQEMKEELSHVRQEIGECRQETRSLAMHIDMRLDSWLKWVLGFLFSSWMTLMASIWLKR